MGIDVEFLSFDELEPEMSLVKGGPGTQSLAEKRLIPSEKTSKTMRVDIRTISFGVLEPEISLIKGCPGKQTGRSLQNTPKGHLPESPGGECFAPC